MTIDPRSPCLVGTARRTWHPGGPPAPEPLAMWDEISRAAALDASATHDLLASVDYLGLVHCQSWAYDNPLTRLTGRLGIEPAQSVESILAGTSPQRLINQAAVAMLRGDCSAALVVGGEALASRRLFDRAHEPPPWSYPHLSPPEFPIDLHEWYLPTELAHGVLPAWLTFALLEQARWAADGHHPQRRQLRSVIAKLATTARTNPDAWFQEERTPDELTTAGLDNRMVASPYTKRMTAFLDVDMAAANLLVTKELADRCSIPEDRRVYLRGWGFARDAVHLAARNDLTSSAGIRDATAEALATANLQVDDIDTFDLYSCFGSAVQFATDALGLDATDERPITVTGGLPYHGGPSSNYLSHSTSHMVDHMRDGRSETAMTTGIGMHLTKHVAAVWSRTPGPVRHGIDPGSQRWTAGPGSADRRITADATGPATLAAATVVYGPDHDPDHALAICDLPDGSRCYARTNRHEVIDTILEGSWVQRRVTISSDTNTHDVSLAT